MLITIVRHPLPGRVKRYKLTPPESYILSDSGIPAGKYGMKKGF